MAEPTANAQAMMHQLAELTRTAHENAADADDPKAQALFETTAEVLQGLCKAYDDYAQRREQAWR